MPAIILKENNYILRCASYESFWRIWFPYHGQVIAIFSINN